MLLNAQIPEFLKSFSGAIPRGNFVRQINSKADAAGNIFVTGIFNSAADFDPGPGVYNLTTDDKDFSDIFLAKYTASGELVFAFAIGGNYIETAYGLAIDVAGNCYITGYFSNDMDLDPGSGVATLPRSEPGMFIAKYDPSGKYLSATSISGLSLAYIIQPVLLF